MASGRFLRTVGVLVGSPVVALPLFAGCVGASKSATPPSTPTTAARGVGLLDAPPSASEKLICDKETLNDIDRVATGIATTAPLTPTWVDHVYSCDYVFPGKATMRLSVRELGDTATTTVYYDTLAEKFDKSRAIPRLGEGAVFLRDGSVVMRFGYKVLVVDVSKLPARFGRPQVPRSQIALAVAEIIEGP